MTSQWPHREMRPLAVFRLYVTLVLERLSIVTFAASNKKAKSRREISRKDSLGTFGHWTIYPGQLRRAQGNPGKTKRLFTAFAEKMPKAALGAVCNHLGQRLGRTKLCGVYVAHDSMGYPRYIGRGSIRERLSTRFRAQQEELIYFSFYVVEDKMHEREVESLLIRAAGPLLDFNDRKVRIGIHAGRVQDFEPGTLFYERHYATRAQLRDAKGE